MRSVSFHNNLGIRLAGNVHYPADFDEAQKYAALVISSPATGVKEQTAGLYARKLAEQGFVAIAMDPSFQGESGGEPRYREDPIARTEDIRGAVDYLVTLPFVDEARIGVLGICAGGGYAVGAAMTERRIRAVGVVVPVNGGREFRAGGAQASIETLQSVAEQRTAEARGAEPMIVTMMTEDMLKSEDNDVRGGALYYLTERGRHPNWANKMRFTGMDGVIGFDAFHLADMLLTQPLQIVVGSEDGSFNSRQEGHDLFKLAASQSKDIVVMEGATHFDMYDQPQYVEPSVGKLAEFYTKNLPK